MNIINMNAYNFFLPMLIVICCYINAIDFVPLSIFFHCIEFLLHGVVGDGGRLMLSPMSPPRMVTLLLLLPDLLLVCVICDDGVGGV